MPRVMTFTGNLQRHLDCPPADVAGGTVREALEAVFAQNPRARGYVFDDQGAVRRHVVIFVGGQPVSDRQRLSDKVSPGSEIDLIYRHGLDVDASGETLALASTTGSLWISEGDGFRTVSHHLPPVYCVRFG